MQRVLDADGEVVTRGQRGIEQAWYRREIDIPADWSGRRVLLEFTMLQTHARVWIDGSGAGEIWFPGGRLDITQYVAAGDRQTLTMLVTARPLSRTATTFAAPEGDERGRARVNNKGIPGDVFLVSEPKQDALGDIHVITSTRQGTITLDSQLVDLSPGTRRLVATIFDDAGAVKELSSDPFDADMLRGGRWSFSSAWADAKRWDLDTPENTYRVVVRLYDDQSRLLDESLPIRFGFREFWIDGRDFYLNGTPVHLRSAAHGKCYFSGRSGFPGRLSEHVPQSQRVRVQRRDHLSLRFCAGTAGYLDAFFEAADETGVLTAFTLPHIKDFAYGLDDPKQQARYKARAEWLIRRAQNHPSIVFYTMNHNSTGYYGDQNPLKIDGKYDPAEAGALASWNTNNRRQAKIAVQIAERLDPSRVVYNHQSGNLGSMHTVNIYLNWAPPQERSDWLEHWATEGVKPVFFVEWGLPHISSWSSYRGPDFIWTTPALQQVWDSEFAAPYVGQSAYEMTSVKVKSMAHEEELWASGQPFAWSNLNRYLSQQADNYREIQALFASDNWRSHRTWGISAMLPWDQAGLWEWARQLETQENRAAYDNLKRPGIVPDVLPPGSQLIYRRIAGEFEPTVLGEAFLRWNQPLIGYIGGGPARVTEKGHNFVPGETVEKQLVILNDSRRRVICRYRWHVEPSETPSTGEVLVEPGTKQLVPIRFPMPAAQTGRQGASDCAIVASFDFGDGNVQSDTFALDAVQPVTDRPLQSNIAVFDPKGMTVALLEKLGVGFKQIDAAADLSPCDVLVLGREAVSPKGRLPDLAPVKDGLKVLVFEQTAEALSDRLGFRINVHGMRRAFVRTPSHPALAGLDQQQWHDWRGAATLTPPYLDVPEAETHDPTWEWCSFENTRVWRCGNNGNLASVLIEKPSRGSFLPLLDCGFDLQYCPLLEYREGLGRILFCQLDVTGRTVTDPAAERIVRNLLAYVGAVPHAEEPSCVLYRKWPGRAVVGAAWRVVQATGPPGFGLVCAAGARTGSRADGWTAYSGRERCQPVVPWSIAGRG